MREKERNRERKGRENREQERRRERKRETLFEILSISANIFSFYFCELNADL